MNVLLHRRRRPAFAVAAVALLAVGAGACSSGSSTSTATTVAGGSASSTVKLTAAELKGSGSTFQQAFDDEVTAEFTAANPQITIGYAGGGSSKGLSDLQNKLVDFAGTDAPIKDYAPYGGASAVLYFPTVAAPITVSYKLSGVSKLTLGGTALAKIFAGKITKWNDPEIAADNAGVTLPGTAITPVHRSDGSGTTHNFTLYLGKADPTDWTFGNSTTYPTTLPGSAASGNPGVAALVEKTDGAIGYVDYATATQANLSLASVKNSAGKSVAPTLQGASAAVAAATVNADLTYDPTDAQGEGAYPITSPTWVVIYKAQPTKAKGEAMKALLSFMLTTGQGKAASTAGYAALQGELLTKAKDQLSQIVIPAS